LTLTSCASIVENQIKNTKSYSASKHVTQQLKTEFDIETRKHCDSVIGCYNYYFAPNKADKSELKMNNNAHFTDTPYSTSLSLERNNAPAFDGTVVVIHGFGGSKDWSLITAGYFQFLGFDVYIFDLLGHGELKTNKGYGIKDAQYLQRFIMNSIDTTKPIIAVGNSMGGLVATTLLHKGVVDGAILQAPMTRFDESLVNYIRDREPWYSPLLSDDTLETAARTALKKKGLDISETDTISLLKEIAAPVLVFASNIDGVSPYDKFALLNRDNIEVVEIDQVEHAYMAMIGQYEHERISLWISSKFSNWH